MLDFFLEPTADSSDDNSTDDDEDDDIKEQPDDLMTKQMFSNLPQGNAETETK